MGRQYGAEYYLYSVLFCHCAHYLYVGEDALYGAEARIACNVVCAGKDYHFRGARADYILFEPEYHLLCGLPAYSPGNKEVILKEIGTELIPVLCYGVAHKDHSALYAPLLGAFGCCWGGRTLPDGGEEASLQLLQILFLRAALSIQGIGKERFWVISYALYECAVPLCRLCARPLSKMAAEAICYK